MIKVEEESKNESLRTLKQFETGNTPWGKFWVGIQSPPLGAILRNFEICFQANLKSKFSILNPKSNPNESEFQGCYKTWTTCKIWKSH